MAARVVGSDLPEMIARVRELVPRGAVVLSSDWDATRAMPFDLIFASLVLQHVPEDWCLSERLRKYLFNSDDGATCCFQTRNAPDSFGNATGV